MSVLPAAIQPEGQISAEPRSLLPSTGGASGRALARSASVTFGLNVGNTIAVVLVTALLARVMSIADFGAYSWAVATVTLLTVPAVLGIDRLLVRDLAVFFGRESLGHVRGMLGWALRLVLATSTVLAVAVWVVILLLSKGAVSPSVVALAVALTALPMVALGRVTQSAAMGAHSVAVSQVPELVLRPILMAGLAVGAIAIVAAPLSAGDAAFIFVISSAGTLMASLFVARRRVLARVAHAPAQRESRQWTVAAVSLALLSGALVINSQSGIVLLGLLDSPDSAGLYFIAQRGAQLVAFPLLAVNIAFAPTAARLWAAGEFAQLQRLVTLSARALLLISVPVALVFVFFGGNLMSIAFGTPFGASAATLTILVVGQVANAATGSVAMLLIMSGNQWRAGVGIVAGIVLNVALAALLIPTLHAEGAAIAAAVGLIVSNVIHVLLARRTLGIDSTALGLTVARR